jgi:hypothetical protein
MFTIDTASLRVPAGYFVKIEVSPSAPFLLAFSKSQQRYRHPLPPTTCKILKTKTRPEPFLAKY